MAIALDSHEPNSRTTGSKTTGSKTTDSKTIDSKTTDCCYCSNTFSSDAIVEDFVSVVVDYFACYSEVVPVN